MAISVEELNDIAAAILQGKSRSYVQDANTLALAHLGKVVEVAKMREVGEAYANLDRVQHRCNELKAQVRRLEGIPEEHVLKCPDCGGVHVDREEWATTRKHKTHLCEHCGKEWRPFPHFTIGVAPKDEKPEEHADTVPVPSAE